MSAYDDYNSRLAKAARGIFDRRNVLEKTLDELQTPVSRAARGLPASHSATEKFLEDAYRLAGPLTELRGLTSGSLDAHAAAASPHLTDVISDSAKEIYESGFRSGQQSTTRRMESFHLSDVAALGEQIRNARKAMKFNQQQFADAAGVGRRFISELENGKESLEIGLVIKCCMTAGIDLFAKARND